MYIIYAKTISCEHDVLEFCFIRLTCVRMSLVRNEFDENKKKKSIYQKYGIFPTEGKTRNENSALLARVRRKRLV